MLEQNEEYKKIESTKQLIIDYLPDGFKKFLNDPLVYHYLEVMAMQGNLNIGNMLVAVLESRLEIQEKFKEYIECGAPPQYIIATEERIEQLKKEYESKRT